jgi:hypothetical protein
VVVEEAIDGVDTTLEDLVHRTSSLVARRCNIQDNDVTVAGASIKERVCVVNCKAVEEPLVVRQLGVDIFEPVSLLVDSPEFDRVVVRSNKARSITVVEDDIHAFLVVLIRGGLRTFAATFLKLPADHLIAIVETTERN